MRMQTYSPLCQLGAPNLPLPQRHATWVAGVYPPAHLLACTLRWRDVTPCHLQSSERGGCRPQLDLCRCSLELSACAETFQHTAAHLGHTMLIAHACPA